MDWLSWPFYRLGLSGHPVRRLFERLAGCDYRIDFGSASYGVLIALERIATESRPNQELPPAVMSPLEQ